MTRRILLACFWLVLAGCQQEATPFPVDIPTASPLLQAATSVPIRYALTANAAATTTDMALLERSALVTSLTQPINPADVGETFDIIAAYGTYPDATPSPISINYTLVINTGLAPLNRVANSFQQSIDPPIIADMLAIPGVTPFSTDHPLPQTAFRTELANAGWPDGIDILLALDKGVGVDVLVTYFARSGIHLNPVPWQDRIDHVHLALVTWTTTDERLRWAEWAGDDNQMIDLFTLPISYWAIPDLAITYSPQGWPIPARQ